MIPYEQALDESGKENALFFMKKPSSVWDGHLLQPIGGKERNGREPEINKS